MGFGDFIDQAIEPFAPRWAADRARARMMFAGVKAANDEVRQYEAAQRGRRTAGWNRPASSANLETARDRDMLARAGQDLARNNKYAGSGIRQLVATLWGDGIQPQFQHENEQVRRTAQDEWDRWAEGKVDGKGDWYGHGKLITREMIVGGEGLTLWRPGKDGLPDGRVLGLEGAHIDARHSIGLSGGTRDNQGIRVNEDDEIEGYWLYREHPNEIFRFSLTDSQFVKAEFVDHVFERQRFGQYRGVSWLGNVAMTLKDVEDIEDATRLREKVQACLALIVQPGEGQAGSPLGVQKKSDDNERQGQLEESLRPGMIARLQPGETMSTVNPQPSSTTVEFIRQQIAAVSANMVPYHLMTGDVSQANYSGLRAAMNGSYTLVDDWQQNELIPLFVRPAWKRRMAVLAMKTGDRRYLNLKATYALPVRRLVDPIKDLMGEVIIVPGCET